MKCKNLSHRENCQQVCVICWNKCPRSARLLEITIIEEFVIENYTPNSVFFPSRMRLSCSRNLYEYRSGNFQRTLGISSDFTSGSLRIIRKNTDCSCCICEIARPNPLTQRGDKHRNTKLMGPNKPEIFQMCSNGFARQYSTIYLSC